MKNNTSGVLVSVLFLIAFLFTNTIAFALETPASPVLTLQKASGILTVSWASPDSPEGYTLFYAPYPNAEFMGEINMGKNTVFSIGLWPDAAFYIAIRAYNGTSYSGFSNIDYFIAEADDFTPSDTTPSGTVFYVNGALKAASPDGKSWKTAFQNVQDGIDAAYNAGGGEVWVAAGTYTPTYIPVETLKSYDLTENADNTCSASTGDFTDEKYKTFFLRDGVTLYGGFIGSETSLSQRDVDANTTILSGDLKGDDCTTEKCGVEPLYIDCNAEKSGFVESGINYNDNVYHVVMSAKVRDAVLDGFTIKGGNASGNLTTSAGTACGFFGKSSDVEIYRILKGYLTASGGGLIVLQSDPIIRNASFINNRAAKGGAAYHMTAESSIAEVVNELIPKYDNVLFLNNFAEARGGAISNDWVTSPVFFNSQFIGNVCESKGGAVYSDNNCDPQFVNVLFAGNRAERGAGSVSDGSSDTFYAYTTTTKNKACDIGAGLYQGTHRVDGNGNSPYAFASIVVDNDSVTNGLAVSNWLWSSLTSLEGSVIQADETAVNDEYTSCLAENYEPAGACADIGWSESKHFDFDDATIASYKSQMTEHGSGDYYSLSTKKNSAKIYVDASAACATACDGSQSKPYTSLRTALGKAGNQTIVYLAPGFYAAMDDGEGLTRESSPYVVGDGVSLVGCSNDFTTCADSDAFISSVQQASDLLNANLPVLSGASGQKDADASDNAYHVVILGSKSALKGVTVQDGYADGEGYHKQGGGLLTYKTSSITLEYVLFTNNFALEGAGMTMDDMPSNDTGSVVSNTVFYKNTADHAGGAVLGRIGELNFKMTFSNVIFEENTARLDRGGAVYMDYGFDADFRDCAFTGNACLASSGAAVYLDDNASQYPGTSLSFYSTSFTGNTAAVHGGAIEVYNSSTTLYIDNAVTFSGNTAGGITNDIFLGFSGTLCAQAATSNFIVEQVDTANVMMNVESAGDCGATTSTPPSDTVDPNDAGSSNGADASGGPPQEAIDACDGLNSGDACSIATPNGTLSGACTNLPGSILACVP